MSALQQASAAYRMQTRTVGTTRSIEYDVLARITRQLQQAAQAGPGVTGALASALHDNRRLWTIFATEVADRNNPLPRDLRARLLYLADFTQQHSSKVLLHGAPLDPLIDVNTSVMRGLAGQAGTS